MIGKLLLSHGGLAVELLHAAEKITGPRPDFAALSFSWDEGCDDVEARLREAIDELDRGDGVLILADMFGDTPCNIALGMLETDRVEMITGMNLPLVVRLASGQGVPEQLSELIPWAIGKARSSVRQVSARERRAQRTGM